MQSRKVVRGMEIAGRGGGGAGNEKVPFHDWKIWNLRDLGWCLEISRKIRV